MFGNPFITLGCIDIVEWQKKNRKNRKIDFSSVSEHSTSFGTKKTALFEGVGGGRGLHVVNEDRAESFLK